MSPLLVLDVVIGWLGARVLSVTECKQASDWLMARPHWAPPRPPSTHTKKRNNWPCGFKASRVRWWKGIRRGGFKAPQRRTPIGPEAIWVKRESMGILQRKGEIISWIFQIIGVSFPHKCGTVAADHYEKSWMQVKLEWMRAEEATRPVERRGSTAVERPRRGALSQETISEVRPGHCGKNERGGGTRRLIPSDVKFDVGWNEQFVLRLRIQMRA